MDREVGTSTSDEEFGREAGKRNREEECGNKNLRRNSAEKSGRDNRTGNSGEIIRKSIQKAKSERSSEERYGREVRD